MSTDQETVITEGDYIQIVPAQPQYIYVPQYDPSVIYVQTWRHDPSHGDPGRYWASRPEGVPGGRYPHPPEVRRRGSSPTGPPGGMFVPRTNTQQFSNRGKESLRTVSQRPAPRAPAVRQRPTPRAPAVRQRPTPQAPAVFGGYRGPNEVKTQSMRGQASRQSNVGGYTPPAPVKRGGIPKGSGAPGGGKQR